MTVDIKKHEMLAQVIENRVILPIRMISNSLPFGVFDSKTME